MQITVSKEYEDFVSPLSDEDFKELKDSIKNNGLWIPIITNEKGIILDGHHRFKICKELGAKIKIAPPRKFESKTEEIIFVGECNLKRRHQTPLQRIELVKKLEPYYAEAAKKRMLAGKKSNPKETFPPGQVRDTLGKKAQVSGRTYDKGTKILEKATTKEIQKINKGEVTISKIHKRIIKDEKKAQRKKILQKNQVKLPKTISIHHKKFQDLKIKNDSVSLIFTDPPYHDKFLYLFEDLAKQAAQVLRDGGSIVTYVGQGNIGKIINIFEKYGLKFHWPITVLHGGASASVFGKKVLVAAKIMLWFVKGKYQGEFVKDVIKSEFEGKELHEWAQSTKESDYYIKYMTIENEIVYDPFLGSGTFGISAKKLKRQFIGCEIDKEHFETAQRLISEGGTKK